MFITLLMSKIKKRYFVFIILFLLIYPDTHFFSQGKPTFQMPSYPSGGTPSSSIPTQIQQTPGTPGQTGTNLQPEQQQERPEMDLEFVPQKFPVIFIGPMIGLHYVNINPRSINTIPEWDTIQFNVGAFVDLRVSKRFAFKITYEFDIPFNITNIDPAKSLHAVSFLARYILAYKHQLWIGLGFTMHILDSFANAELNAASVTAGYLSDVNTETQKRFIFFFTIYIGYMLQLSDLLVLDVQASYGLLNTFIKSWRYNSFRINIGLGFKL